MMNTAHNKLKEVLNYFGGVSGLANALQIDRHAIYQWKKIPLGRAYQIEVLSNGKFKASQLINHNTHKTLRKA